MLIVRSASSLALSLALAACGPQSVSPTDSDGGSDGAADATPVGDGSAPSGACAAPIALFDEDMNTVQQLVFTRAASGYVGVTSSRDGAVFAQAYSAQWAPVGERLALPSRDSNERYAFSMPAVAFEQERGAVSFGASVHELRIDASLQLTLVGSLLVEEGATLFNVHSAWPRTDGLGRQRITVITNDGSAWHPIATGLQRTYRTSTMTRLVDASLVFESFDDRFTAFEGIAQRDINNRVRFRRFIPGHGVMTVSGERTEIGTAASPAVRIGDSAWRVHFVVGSPSSMQGNTLSLVEHGIDGSERSRVALSEQGYAQNAAIGVSDDNAAIERSLIAWSTFASGSSERALKVQWGPRGTTETLLRATADSPMVHGAWVEASGARAWVVYGLYETSSAMPRRRVFARCVEQ
jgi:hypothetical protein